MSGLLVSSFRAVKYMKLFYRSIELCKSGPLSDGASYEDKTSLSSQARSDLQWVIDSLANNNGCPLTTPSPDVSVETDASKLGWGACFNGINTGGLWSLSESVNHITCNYLETLVASFLRSNALYQSDLTFMFKFSLTIQPLCSILIIWEE